MTIHQMECFLTLSELLNFTRAAEVLHMTQPTLSKMLSSMEDEIGTPLVHRTKRSVTLTNAGQSLCQHFRKILNEYQHSVELALVAGQGKRGCIRIGFSSIMTAVILPELVRKLRVDSPDVDVILCDGTQVELVQMLSLDELDLIFTDTFILSHEGENLNSISISKEPLGVMLSQDHPLANRDLIYVDDLRNDNILTSGRMVQSPSFAATTNGTIASVLYKSGLLSNATRSSRTMSNMIVMVDCNMGVALLPRQMLGYAPATVRFIPLAKNDDGEDLSIDIIAAWKKDTTNSCVEAALAAIRSILERVN